MTAGDAPASAVVTTYFADYAWLGGDAVTRDVAIDVAGGRIVAVRPGAPRAGTHLRGVTLPGLANAHSHAFQRALRGRTQRGGGSASGRGARTCTRWRRR